MYDAELPVIKGEVVVSREDHYSVLLNQGFLPMEDEEPAPEEGAELQIDTEPQIKKNTLNR